MKFKTAIYISVLVLFSCKTNSEYNYKKCVENSNGITLLYPENYNIWDELLAYETKLIREGVLKNKTQEAYVELFKKIWQGNVSEDELSLLRDIKENPMDFSKEMFYDCLGSEVEKTMLDTNKNTNKTLLTSYMINSKFLDVGLKDPTNVETLLLSFNKKDFKKEIYRLQVTTLLIINVQ